MDPKLQEALLGLETRLHEKLKLPQDVIRKTEVEAMIADALKLAHPEPKAGMVMPGAGSDMEKFAEFVATRLADFKTKPNAYSKAAPWESEYGKKFKNMQGFLRACVKRDPALEHINLDTMEKASSDAMTEGTGSSGGYLVPTEFRYEVIRLLNASAMIRSIARIVPMGTWKRTLPKQSSAVAIAWVTEFGTKSVTKPGFGQFTQQAKVMAAIVKSSDELLRDAGLNVQQFVAELIAEAMALEEERVALAGDVSGAGDPFNGVLYASGVAEVTMAASEIQYDDLIDLKGGITEAYEDPAIFVMKRDALHLIMKLKDGQGQPIWHGPRDGNPGQILSKPYKLSAQLPTDLGATSDKTPILYGDFGRYLWISDREGMAVKVSQDASDWVSGALDSAFMSDQTWLRFTRALSIDVALANAFAYMLVK